MIKLRLAEEQKKERISWTQTLRINLKTLEVISIVVPGQEVVFRRCKLKILLQTEFEKEEEAEIKMPHLQSRRFPLKEMFLQIVGNPIPK